MYRLRKRLQGTSNVTFRRHRTQKSRTLKTGSIRFTNLSNYLAIVVSTAVVSAVTTAESTTTVVESVVASDVPLPPHATNVVAIAKIAITFFICLFVLLFKLNCTLIKLGIGTSPMPVPTQCIDYPTQLFLNVLAFFNDVSY